MKKIALLKINSSYSHSNLALPLIESFVGDSQYSWSSVEGTINEAVKVHLLSLIDIDPDIILVSFYLFNRTSILSILKRFKAINPNCLIIAGGPEFLGDNLKFLSKNKFIDIVVRGEGEIPVKEILQNNNIEDISGLSFLKDGNYIDNGMSEELADLDRIPSPYINDCVNWERPFIQLETSRGCPNSCSFCTSSLSRGVRYFSLSRIREDLLSIQKHDISDVRIIDRTFNIPEKRAISLLQFFRKEFSDIHFHLEINPANLGDGLKKELLKANDKQLHIEIGVQSLESGTIESVNRKSTVDSTLAGAEFLNKIENLTVHADLISGLPGATIKSLLNNLNHLIKLKIGEIQLETLKLLPGTELAINRKKFSIVASPEPPYEVLLSADMTFYDIVFAEKLSRFIDCFYNYLPLQGVIILAVNIHLDFIYKFTSFLDQKELFLATPSPQKRFKVLLQFFEESYKFSSEEIIDSLTVAWFKCSFSPQHGPFPAIPWKEDIPESAKLISGSKATGRYKRIFFYKSFEIKYLFAYKYPNDSVSEVTVFKLK